MGQLKQDTDETRSDIGKRLAIADGYYSKQYEQVHNDLEFASGKQWDDEDTASRERDGRPTITLNHTRTYIDRIVNALRVSPIGIQIETENDEVTQLLQDKVRDIEYRNDANTCYEIAYENAVTSGLGYIILGTDYVNDEELDQTITMSHLQNPTCAFLDPLHKNTSGADAEWGGYIEYMDKNQAEDMHGEEVTTGSFADSSLWSHWKVPENTVPDMVFYERQSVSRDRTWLTDGTYTDEDTSEVPADMITQQRKIMTRIVKVYHFIGDKMVDYTELPISWIPIVPVYGDTLNLSDDNIYYGGIVHKTRDLNRIQNYLASTEMELAGQIPKSPILISEGQLEGHEEEWDNANTSPKPYLTYNPETSGEQLVGPPQRMDNNPQTMGLQAMRQQYTNEYASVTGMFPQMFGQGNTTGTSGRAILLRQSDSELTVSQYLDNLSKSIAQVGRIMVEMMSYVYDVEQDQTLRSSEGKVTRQNLNIGEVLEAVGKDLNITAHAGPSYESRRRESLAAMLEIGRISPAKFENMLDLMVDNLDAPGSKEISARLKKMLPPELQDQEKNAPDPQAIQALQVAEQTISEQEQTVEYLQGIVRQLQSAMIDDKNDRQQRMAEAQIKAETAVVTTQMDNVTKIELEQIKAQSKLEDTMLKMQSDFDQRMNDMQNEAQAMFAQLSQQGLAPVEDYMELDEMQQQAPIVPGPVRTGLEEDFTPEV